MEQEVDSYLRSNTPSLDELIKRYGKVPVYSELITHYLYDEELPSDVELVDVLEHLIRTGKEFLIPLAIKKCLKEETLGDIEKNYIVSLLDEKSPIRHWLLREEKNYTDYPSWVSKKSDETKELLEKSTWKDVVLKEERPPLKFTFNNEDTTDEVMSVLDNILMVSDCPYNPDRLFGPVNGRRSCEGSIAPGGCRMLTCNCREEGEWFTGKCDYCKSDIRDISHALRLPLVEGSWVGCYCSMDCIVKDNIIDSKTRFLMDILFSIVFDEGILDRTFL